MSAHEALARIPGGREGAGPPDRPLATLGARQLCGPGPLPGDLGRHPAGRERQPAPAACLPAAAAALPAIADRPACPGPRLARSEEHTSELQSRPHLVCRLLL